MMTLFVAGTFVLSGIHVARSTEASRIVVRPGVTPVAMNWIPLLDAVPPFSFSANDRLRFVAIFFAAILSARIVDRRRSVRTPVLLIAPLIVLGLATHVFMRQYGVTLSPISAVGIISLLCISFAKTATKSLKT